MDYKLWIPISQEKKNKLIFLASNKGFCKSLYWKLYTKYYTVPILHKYLIIMYQKGYNAFSNISPIVDASFNCFKHFVGLQNVLKNITNFPPTKKLTQRNVIHFSLIPLIKSNATHRKTLSNKNSHYKPLLKTLSAKTSE